MEIKSLEEKGFVVVEISGELDTMTTSKADIFLKDLLKKGNKKFAIDFSGVNYISSTGLRLLLTMAKELKAKQGVLRIFALSESVKEIFDISGFSSILTIVKDKLEAIKDGP